MCFLIGKNLDRVADFACIDEEGVVGLLRKRIGIGLREFGFLKQGRGGMAAECAKREDRNRGCDE
ncbi:hypothetical protein D3C87_1532390 [compost metagenome]